MDELEAVRRLLTQPPPSPEVVEAARSSLGRAGVLRDAPLVHLNGARHMLGSRPPARRHRWRGWLAPAAAAVAVIAVVAGSLAISGAIGRHHHAVKTAGGTAAAVARAGVPRYFVALPGSIQGSGAPRAVVGVTATGQILGAVAAPKRYGVFDWATASGNDRVFVLAAQRKGSEPSQYRFYRLVLSRSGRPGPLTLLPVPPQTGYINGFALSPDGTKLATSFLPGPAPGQHSKIEVFDLASGSRRDWTLPGNSLIGWTKPFARSLSWEADNRTLLFLVDIPSSHAGAFLLDTASGGSTPTRIPIPRQEMSATIEKGVHISGPMLVTGDGAKVVAPTVTSTVQGGTRTPAQRAQAHRLLEQGSHLSLIVQNAMRHHAPAKIIQRDRQRVQRVLATYHKDGLAPTLIQVVTITEFSVESGKPVAVLDRQQTQDQGWTDVQWTGASGTSLIAVVPGPPAGAEHIARPVIGVQDGVTFTALPQRVQRAFRTEQIAW